jgi:hypothetical protein
VSAVLVRQVHVQLCAVIGPGISLEDQKLLQGLVELAWVHFVVRDLLSVCTVAELYEFLWPEYEKEKVKPGFFVVRGIFYCRNEYWYL